ncbi:MAG: transcriptional regulator, family [Herbinix sp.]|jgi:flagellar biosynthesis component FlhA|nr:transcriptional regulator, family [Herbinix sp.]
MNQIGDKIAIKRQNMNMTQEEFALKLGVTPQAVSKWERNQGLPDIGMLVGICTVLSIDANELLGFDIPKNVVENNDLAMQLDIQKNMISEPLMLEFGAGFIPVFMDGIKTNYINEQRKKLVSETGMLAPVIRIYDNVNLAENEYQIKAYDKVLKNDKIDLDTNNLFEYLIDDLFSECRKNYYYILNKQVIKSMMDNLNFMYPGIINGIIPEKIDYLTIMDIFKEIIKRNGIIRNQIKIIEITEKEIIINNNTNISSIVDKIFEVL